MATTQFALAPPPAKTPPLVRRGGLGRKRSRPRLPRYIRRAIGPLLLIAAWQVLCSSGVFNPRTLASPLQVLHAAQQLSHTGELQTNLMVSLRRVAIGACIGITVGAVVAVLAGLSRIGEDLIDPMVQIFRSVPLLGLIPLVIIWFGIGEESKILLIALGCSFPIYINTYGAIRSVDARLVELADTLGLGRFALIRRVILPGALPGFLTGLRLSLVSSWLIVIVAEQINASSGLGYLINQAQGWFRTDIIVLGLAIYGLLGLATDAFVRLLERTLLSWRQGFMGT